MKTRIKGHIVEHDATVSKGIRYLIYEINAEEAKVFFDHAFSHGSATFEDHMGIIYKLVHHGSEYKLIKG
ncbi:MAG: hypothetical protein WC711_01475 [Candidatus Staskawiczbacteria bacterium]|jgi:hypothetical protein